MAYKFQIGAAVLSGSIKAEDGLVATDVDDTTAANIVAQIDAGEIAIAKLAASTISGKALGNNLDALSVTAEKGLSMTSYDGQAAVSDLQVVLDGAGGLEFNGASGIRLEAAVAGNGLAHSAGVLSVQTSGSIVIDGDKIGISGSFAGPGLLSAGGPNSISSLEVAVDDSSIATNGGGDLIVKALGVTNAMLAGSIADSKLSTIATSNKVSGTAIQLATNTAIEDSTGLRLKAATAGDGLALSAAQVLSVQTSGSIVIDADKIGISGSFAGPGLRSAGGPNSISSLEVAADDSSLEIDGSSGDLQVKALGVTNAMLAGSIANAKLANSTISGKALGANLDALAVDDSSIEYSAGSAFNGSAASTIRVKALGVTNAMLAGSIANAKLANDGITIAGADTSLGGSITAAAILNTDMGGAFTIGNQSDDVATFSGGVVVAGNLTVQGSAVEVQQGFVVTGSVQFEGTIPDGNELTLTTANPTADRTVTIPDLSGHVPLLAGAISTANVTAAEFAILDGDTSATATTIVAADRVILNDAGTMVQCAMSDIKTFVSTGLDVTLNVQNIDDAGTLAAGVNYFSALGGAEVCQLPQSPTIGASVKVKAPSNCSSTNKITINKHASSAGHSIDGQAFIILESPDAAVECIYVAANLWKVF